MRQSSATAALAAATTESDAEQRAEYTRAVLAQYRKHVTTTLEPELERLRNDNAELRYDAQMAHEELSQLRQRLASSADELADLRRQLRQSRDETDTRVQRASEYTEDRVQSIQKVAQMEIQQLKDELHRCKAAIQAMRDEGYDPDVTRKLQRAQAELRDAQASRDALSEKCAALQRQLDDFEDRQLGVKHALNALSEANIELQGLVREAGDFGSGVCTAFGLMDCECTEVSTSASQWRSLAASFPTNHGGLSGSDVFSKLKREVDGFTLLASGGRQALAQEHQGLAVALKRLITRHTDVLESAAAAEHQRQQEKELARRRIAELEDDRKVERESMLTALEKERVKSRLMSVGSSTPSTIATQPAPRKSLPESHVGTQTGAELIDVKSEHQQLARWMSEVVSLQNQLAHFRETIHLLEQQRRMFMDFVDDVQVTAHVARATQGEGAPTSEEFMTYGVSLL